MSIKHQRLLLAAVVMIILLVLLAFVPVDANSAAAGTNSDVIGRRLTVQEIEDRADMLWSISTAADWDAEDHAACMPNGFGLVSPGLAGVYTRCMVMRSNTRFLYMLRRGCTGVSSIADACKMEVMKK